MNNEEFERIVQTIPTFNNRVKMLEYRRSLILKITTLETINLGLIQEKAELERGITLDDDPLANRNIILKEFLCPTHGKCMPYIIGKLRAIALRDAQLTANEEEE